MAVRSDIYDLICMYKFIYLLLLLLLFFFLSWDLITFAKLRGDKGGNYEFSYLMNLISFVAREQKG